MAAPTVTTCNPSTGAGDAAVLITGTGFAAATAVAFGGIPALAFSIISATQLVATAPVHAAGAVTVTVTNADGTSADAVTFTFSDSMILFTVAEARAFDKKAVENSLLYTDAAITAKEAAIRAKFERVIGVSLSATTSTEYYDGDWSCTVELAHHNPWSESAPRPVTITSVSLIDTAGTETAFTSAELAALAVYPDRITSHSCRFPWGRRNVKVVYTHGYTTVPDDIKQAALIALCMAPPHGLVPSSVTSFATEGMDGTINWSTVTDPTRNRWFGNDRVDGILNEHRGRETALGIA